MRVTSLLRKSAAMLRRPRGATRARAELAAQSQQLAREMADAEQPWAVNARLNDLERRLGRESLQSFPTDVAICTTSVCNARCTFCHYTPKPKPLADFISLDDVKKMTWLNRVSTLNLNSGYGDSLVHPHFGDIYDYIRQTHPHLTCTLVTNGLGLTEALSRQFVGHLSDLLISVNATRSSTWQALMQRGCFDQVIEAVARLTVLKRLAQSSKPRLAMSMILFRDNIEEAVEFVELAHRLGVEKVVFVHYLSVSQVGSRRMSAEHSLYYNRAGCDRAMEVAARRAGELGLELHRPLPFAAGPASVFVGDRVAQAPPACDKPWKSCSLSCLPGPERHREMVFCCFGAFYRIAYAKDDLSEEFFLDEGLEPSRRAILPPNDQRARVQPRLRRLPDLGSLRSGQCVKLSRTPPGDQCGLSSRRLRRLAKRN